MSLSARLGLPLLASGQAQKEITHNEAIQLLDTIVAACVEELPVSAPPSNPALGACYIVGPAPSGAWAGKSGCLACFTNGGWRFLPPRAGMSALIRPTGLTATYRTDAWDVGTNICTKVMVDGKQVVGAQAGAVNAPTGGTTVDVQCREAVALALSALRQHGLIAA